MSKRKCIAFVLLTGVVGGVSGAQVSLTKKLVGATLGAATLGGGTLCAAWQIGEHIYLDDEVKGLSATGIAALLGGVSGWIIASKMGPGERELLETQFAKAIVPISEGFKSPLLVCEQEKLAGVVLELYKNESDPYGKAVESLKSLREEFVKAKTFFAEVLIKIKEKEDEWAVYLRKKLNQVSEKLFLFTNELGVREKILVQLQGNFLSEKDYNSARNQFRTFEKRVSNALRTKQLASVRDSQYKLLSYELSVVNENRPYVTILNRLRKTASEMRGNLEECRHLRAICLRKANDDRYNELANSYAALSERMEKEFPWEELEERIIEIHSSQEYATEIAAKEKAIKHKEIVQSLMAIKSDMEKELSFVKERVKGLKNDTARLEGDVSRVNKVVEDIDRDVKGVNEGVRITLHRMNDIENKINMALQEISILKRSNSSQVILERLKKIEEKIASLKKKIKNEAATRSPAVDYEPSAPVWGE